MDVGYLACYKLDENIKGNHRQSIHFQVFNWGFRGDDADIAFVVAQGDAWTVGPIMAVVGDAEGEGCEFAWVEPSVVVPL